MVLGNFKVSTVCCLLSIIFVITKEINGNNIQPIQIGETQSQVITFNITNIITEFLKNNISNENDRGTVKFLEDDDKMRSLKISDFTLNGLFYLIERVVKLDILAKNDSSNPLPIAIDSESLSIMVNELKKYQQNIPMSLRIYHNKTQHHTPRVITDPEGSLLTAELGMEFAVLPQKSTEYVPILNFDLILHLKYQLETTANKFSFGMKYVNVKDININYDELSVNTEKLKVSLTNFIKVAYDSIDENITDVDVLKIINNFISSDFTKFDIFMDYGYFMIMIG